jgi:hypothetical protein
MWSVDIRTVVVRDGDYRAIVEVLGTRQLNRATLARQFLLERVDLTAVAAVERLAGMQAQAPHAPYVGLWSRLAGFHPDDVGTALVDRRLVRAGLMRGTIHLVSAADALAWGPLTKVVLERALNANFGRRLTGVDLGVLVERTVALLARRPHTRAELAAALHPLWPGHDKLDLAYAATCLVPVVQIPPRGVWGESGQATWASMADWLGESAGGSLADMIVRFLTAFGPASVRDMRTWSGLTRLREVVADMDLRTYRDERGTTLYDLPDAELPDPDTPAPPRFLPEYDNLLLSYADRERVAANHRAVPLPPGPGGVCGTLLVDGFWRGTWRITRADGTATLLVEPFEPLTDDVTEEAARLVRFAAPDAEHHDVKIVR